jgi:taurine dioxygenase
MNYHIDNNGWTVIIDNFDLRTAEQSDIDQISKLLYSNTVVVIKKQQLSLEDELRIIKMFSSPTDLGFRNISIDNSDGLILRVGGYPDENGVQGIAEHEEEMGWHTDFQWRLKHQTSLIWLHVVRGAEGSKTTWINNLLSYQDLDQTTKDLLDTLTMVMLKDTDHNTAKFYTDLDGTRWPHGTPLEGYYPKVMREGRLYFPFNQIYNFVGMTREESKSIILPIMNHITQIKYQYTHEWDLGDIVISDQWSGVHMRWPCKNIKNRLIHRATFDYTIKE